MKIILLFSFSLFASFENIITQLDIPRKSVCAKRILRTLNYIALSDGNYTRDSGESNYISSSYAVPRNRIFRKNFMSALKNEVIVMSYDLINFAEVYEIINYKSTLIDLISNKIDRSIGYREELQIICRLIGNRNSTVNKIMLAKHLKNGLIEELQSIYGRKKVKKIPTKKRKTKKEINRQPTDGDLGITSDTKVYLQTGCVSHVEKYGSIISFQQNF